jgi:enoyl-[acyl-carrier protein] reductase I
MALLDGKKALVSGVANKNSIAWGIARALYAHGSQIAFTCHPTNLRRLNKLAAQVDSETIVSCDVGKDEEISRAFDQVGNVFGGRLDILVHSVAYANLDDLGGEFIKTSRSGWNLALDISAYSLVAFARCARPLMKAAGEGSIMTLTFGDGKVVPGYNIMGVAKAALEMAVRYLAYDLGPENVRVNAIASGPIQTISSLAIEDFSVALRMMEERSPLLRNVTLEDLGRTAVYLASDFSRAVTGSVIKVDSGMNIMCPSTAPHRKLKEAYEAWLKQARKKQ